MARRALLAARREQARLEALEDIGGPDIVPDDELRTLVRLAASIAGVSTAALNLIGATQQCQVATAGFEGGESPRDEAMCNVTLEAATVMHVPDAAQDPLFSGNPWVTGIRGTVRFYAAVPIITAEGHVLGTICVFDDEPKVLDLTQLDQLVDLSHLALSLLQHRRDSWRNEQLTAAAEEATALLDHTFAELEERHEFIQALLETVDVGIVAAGADGRLTVFNRAARTWHGAAAVADLDQPQWSRTYHLFEPDGETPLPANQIPLLRTLREGSVHGAEMVIAPPEHEPVRVVCDGTALARSDGSTIGGFVVMRDITRQRQLEERLRASALRDPLTELPNRLLVMERLEHALATVSRSGARVGVLFCDLDGFKQVNDQHGHAAGDEVIVEIGRRLAECVRPGDTVGRLAGDEFVIVCAEVDDRAVRAIAGRVAERVSAPIVIRDLECRLGVSIGVAISEPGEKPADLIERADTEMYRAKGTRLPKPRSTTLEAARPTLVR